MSQPNDGYVTTTECTVTAVCKSWFLANRYSDQLQRWYSPGSRWSAASSLNNPLLLTQRQHYLTAVGCSTVPTEVSEPDPQQRSRPEQHRLLESESTGLHMQELQQGVQLCVTEENEIPEAQTGILVWETWRKEGIKNIGDRRVWSNISGSRFSFITSLSFPLLLWQVSTEDGKFN